MASIENRSRIQITVKNRDDLTKVFARNAVSAIQDYILELRSQGLKPRLTSLDDYYLVRTRSVAHKNQVLIVHSETEAIETKQRLESEQRQGLFVDYATGNRVTFADLLIRYLREESPRHKGFEDEAYKINAWLEDAGLPRQDLAEIVAAHPNPHPKVVGMKIRKSTGKRVGQSSEATKFIRKAFSAIVPDDFTDYIDERCQVVEPATVDREIDIFSAVCHIAINTWRIPVQKSPMDGVRRPRYYNERERRLTRAEEERLLEAAREQDRKQSIDRRREELMANTRREAGDAATIYQRKQVIKEAREHFQPEAEQTYEHVPLLETFIQFQLMTGARRSETLTLTWANVDLDTQTAYLPETKNGRARKLPLRSALVNMLRELPRSSEFVFPIGVDGLRKAWKRICKKAGLTGVNELRIHDLRHEAISRVAEAGSSTPGGFSLVDLQHFSGHRDVRMLLRYAHLCTQSLAKRLDSAFGDDAQTSSHHGVRRLKKGAPITLQEVIATSAASDAATSYLADNTTPDTLTAVAGISGNVIRVNFGRRAA